MNSKKYQKSAINEIQPPADSTSGLGLGDIYFYGTWSAIIIGAIASVFVGYKGGRLLLNIIKNFRKNGIGPSIAQIFARRTAKSTKPLEDLLDVLQNPQKLKKDGIPEEQVNQIANFIQRSPGVIERLTQKVIENTFRDLKNGKLTLEGAYKILRKQDKDLNLWNSLKQAFPNAKRWKRKSSRTKIKKQTINYNALPSITLKNSTLSERDFITLATKKLISPRWASSYGLSRDWTSQFSLLVRKIDSLNLQNKRGWDFLQQIRNGKKWGGRSIGFISPQVRNAIDDFYALRTLGDIKFHNTSSLYNRTKQPLSFDYWKDDLAEQLKQANRSSWWINKSQEQKKRLSKLIFSMLEK